MAQNINEGCGCGGNKQETGNTKNSLPFIPPSNSQDPNVGRFATVKDGRSGTINDSIRNSSGDVIGYVINNERGNFRVFRDNITQISESEGAMSSLAATPGMGEVAPPTRTSTGSGDQFPSLNVGTPAAKGKKEKSKKTSDDDVDRKSVMSWNDFKKKMTKLQ